MEHGRPVSKPPEGIVAAVRAFGARDWTQAESLCRRVLLEHSRHADALHVLGLVLSQTDRREEAIETLRDATAVQPQNATLWMNLGKVYCDAGLFAEAAECQRTVIALKEDSPAAHFNLSLAYQGLGQFESAIAAVRRSIQLRPDSAKAHHQLGGLLHEEGRLKEAVAAYQTALLIDPDWAEAHFSIAAAWCAFDQPAKALEHLREFSRLGSPSAAAEALAGHALRALGRIGEAKAAYARAAEGESIDGKSHCRNQMAILARESMAEVIAPDRRSIAEHVTRVTAAIEAFARRPRQIDLSELHTQGAVPDVVYYHGNLRAVMEQYAQAVGPHVPREPLPPRRRRPRLGIVVTGGHEGVFSRCWGQIAQRLSRQRFDVRLVCSRAGANFLQTVLGVPPDEYLRLPAPLDQAAQVLREHQFDWLHYWEIGTDQTNYYLPFFRPAPGQSTCWGWPVTSGNPHADSYVSCRQLEPPDAEAHYTEQLVLLENLPTYYIRPPAPSGPLTKDRFGLQENQRCYLCTQNLRKYHPDFDPLVGDLLRGDPEGLLLLMGDTQPSITELLLARFRRTIPEVVSRIRMMPRMGRDDYLALVAVADVILDTLHYGGGANTVYDAAAMGAPIVTLPGEFHRSRWAAAVNRRLGLEQLIASTREDYVAKAVEVASNPDLRQALRQQILEAGAELFEDAAVVREHEEYFSQAIAAVRAGV
jgi:predicted O-linked N-acetylglucosamine transferase (SPINDLY family)